MERNKIALIVIILIGIALIIPACKASPGPIVTLDPTEIEIPYCETKNISVCVENFTGLWSFEFKIWWLKDVVNYTGHQWKPFPPEWLSPIPAGPAFGENATHKSVAFGVTPIMGDPFNYSGRWTFIDTYWHCLKPEVNSPLIFDRNFTKLYDRFNNPIPIGKINDGLIINVPAIVGGISIPVDKLALLAPYIISTVTIILAVSISVVYIKYRKKQ